jgi:DNA-binding transcriptional regulator YiaG
MTPDDFRRVREALGMTQAELAGRLAVTARSVRHYEAGDRTISPMVQRLLEYIVIAATIKLTPQQEMLLADGALSSLFEA